MPFQKNHSGNPHGDNATSQIRRVARGEADKCISALARVRDDEHAPQAVQVEASTILLMLAHPQFGEQIAQRSVTMPALAQQSQRAA